MLAFHKVICEAFKHFKQDDNGFSGVALAMQFTNCFLTRGKLIYDCITNLI